MVVQVYEEREVMMVEKIDPKTIAMLTDGETRAGIVAKVKRLQENDSVDSVRNFVSQEIARLQRERAEAVTEQLRLQNVTEQIGLMLPANLKRIDLVSSVRELLAHCGRLEKENATWCENATEKEQTARDTNKGLSLPVQFSTLVNDAIQKRVDEWMEGVGRRIEKVEADTKEAKKIANRVLTGFASHEGRLARIEGGKAKLPENCAGVLFVFKTKKAARAFYKGQKVPLTPIQLEDE